jgi:hypothetical protein
MKSTFPSSFCCFVSAALTVFNASTAVGQDWARKMFKETSHNFGEVVKGELPEHRFEIENIYQEDVVIDRVTTSCPCIIASLADNKNVLKTWDKGAVVGKFNSPAFDGNRQATITVRFSRPFVAEVQLNLSGNIIRGVNFTPSSIEFGQVSESNLPTKLVKIASSSSGNFRVLDVKSTFPHVAVQLKETARSAQFVNYDMSVRLKPSVPGGFTQGELYVIVQEGSATRQIPIKFSLKVVNALQLPESITLGPVSAGAETSRKVILKSDQEFRVTDVTCQNPGYRVKANGQSKKVHFVDVFYKANDRTGQFEDELAFYIDNLPEPAGKLKVYVEVVSNQQAVETKN